MAIKKSTVMRNVDADGFARQHDNGYVRLYSGTRPANPQTAITGAVVHEARFSATSAAAASAGTITWSVVTANATVGGSPTHFRTFKADGTTVGYDGDVSDSGGSGDLKLQQTGVAIAAGAPVVFGTWTYTVPE